MRPAIVALLVILLAPAAARAATVDAGELRAEVDDASGALRFGDLLAEAGAHRVGFRTATGSFRATRALSVTRDGAAVVADLATNDPAGRVIRLRVAPDAAGIVAVEASVAGSGVTATDIGFDARDDERYLGFGERSNAVDQRGNDVEVFVGEGPYQPEERPFIAAVVPPQGYHPRDDATYFPLPWLLSTAGYGVLLDNAETSMFHLASERPDVWSVEVAAPRIAFRVFAGPRPADVLARFTARLGRQPPVAAPWVFGAWWQPTPGTPAPEQLDAQRRADVPISVTETFLHYLPCADHLPDRDRPRANAAALHERGTAVLAYMNPMVCTSHPAYEEAAANGWFNTDATGRPYRYRYSTAEQFEVSQVDFTSPGGRDFFGRLLREAVEDGFDGWMEDFGEYTPADARSSDGTPGAQMHNLYPTLYHRTATEQTAAVGRPIANYVRSGFTGTAPYARIVWGGDPTTDWGFDGLASSVKNGLTMGLSGISTWGSDIGGFFSLGSRRVTPELFKRWIQFGAVSGVMRAKSKGIALPEKARPQVETPEVLPIWRRYAKLRTQLLPYLEAADAEYQRTGMPIMRSLALMFPDQGHVGGVEDAFMFGPDVLAAPVIEPGATSRRVALPNGRWIDLWRSVRVRDDGGLDVTGVAPVEGGGSFTIAAPIEELPLLVRAGTVLPLLPADVDTLAPYPAPGAVSLEDRRSRLDLLVFPRGWSDTRPFGRERVVSSEKRRRRWVLRLEGERRRTWAVQAALGSLRRPFRPCSVTVVGLRAGSTRAGRAKRRRVPFRAEGDVLRFEVRGRRLRVEASACRRR
ncbi:MAG TPA: TIM-barrel domain-containing protein [Solirubrobacteraceae bacterium]|nr:TIM-barrel domain-containing protein [Solirubrobacteraceae bacterium]